MSADPPVTVYESDPVGVNANVLPLASTVDGAEAAVHWALAKVSGDVSITGPVPQISESVWSGIAAIFLTDPP